VILASANQQVAPSPVNVFQTDAADLAGAETQARQQQKDGAVAEAFDRSLVRLRQHLGQIFR